MPCRHNEKPVLGPWRAEYWAYVGHKQDENGVPTDPIRRWRAYNRPHHHIHSGDKYDFEYLAPNLKAANRDQGHGRETFTLRMRNIETGDVIMADIL
jgi:hypothetical protein